MEADCTQTNLTASTKANLQAGKLFTLFNKTVFTPSYKGWRHGGGISAATRWRWWRRSVESWVGGPGGGATYIWVDPSARGSGKIVCKAGTVGDPLEPPSPLHSNTCDKSQLLNHFTHHKMEGFSALVWIECPKDREDYEMCETSEGLGWLPVHYVNQHLAFPPVWEVLAASGRCIASRATVAALV